ncbi:MAG: hypothetical protein ACRDWS_01505 [Acidimicrobiia bacterium]
MSLSRRRRKLLFAAHLIVAVGLIGADAVLISLTIAGFRGADPVTVYPAAHRVASTVLVPLAWLALATGLLQGLATRWGLLRHWWVTIKLTLTAVLVGLATFLLRPSLGEAASTALTGAPLSSGAQLRLVLIPTAAVSVLILIVSLAVYKPLGRLPRARSRR